jgi:hypothetical protein
MLYLTIAAGLCAPRRRGGDRGDGLAWAALAVGGLAIVTVVVLILKEKAASIARNVCTEADPTTCR